MIDSSQRWITIRSDELTAQIDPQGAQLSVLQTRAGLNLLWSGDPAHWAGRAPLLFPIVGALNGGNFRIGNKHYSMPRHGFARTKTFAVRASAEASATFRLSADAATRDVYPFDFDFDVNYRLAGATLSMTVTIVNRRNSEMLASFGYHPAFTWPLPFGQTRESHSLRFDQDETAAIRRLDEGGLLKPNDFPTPIAQGRLMLRDELFRDDVVILDRLRSRSLLYGSDSGPRLRIGFPDARYLGIWTKINSPFICIEPWHGIADPTGFRGDFSQKPGILAVAPLGSFSSTMTVGLER